MMMSYTFMVQFKNTVTEEAFINNYVPSHKNTMNSTKDMKLHKQNGSIKSKVQSNMVFIVICSYLGKIKLLPKSSDE